jgi:hypothetical protein
MEKQAAAVVDYVLKGFLHAEYGPVPEGFTGKFHATIGKPWDQFDTDMCFLVWLTDDEIYREASLAHEYHIKHNARSPDQLEDGSSTVETILKAVENVLELYNEGGAMTFAHRHLLEY